MAWSTTSIGGKKCEVFEPSAPGAHGYTVIFLHDADADRLSGRAAFSNEFERHGLRVIAPEGGRSWWLDRPFAEFDERLTAERFVVDVVLDHLRERWNVAPPRIGLMGIAVGGQGALRLAFRHANRFPVVAAISPAIDFHVLWNEGDEALQALYPDAETARQDTATLHVHPLNWPRNIWFCCDPADRWYESADRLHMKLGAIGIPHEYDLETTGGGHTSQYFDRMAGPAIDFLAARLESERLRVV